MQYAVAVADTGGFRRAAEACHVSQPSLSAQLVLLEEALGVRLFERSRQGVLATAAGVELIDRARALLTGADDLRAAAARLTDPLCGTLRIGVIPTVSPYLLPEVTPGLRRRFPKLTLQWSEERTEQVLKSLREGRVDAALLALVPGMDGLAHEPIVDEPFVLAGAKDLPIFKRHGKVRLSELQGASLLLLEDGHCFREQALSLCSHVAAHEAGYRATSLATLARMASSGAGLTLLPALAVLVENRHGELATRSFAPPAPLRSLVLAFRDRAPIEPALRLVAREMAAACPKLD